MDQDPFESRRQMRQQLLPGPPRLGGDTIERIDLLCSLHEGRGACVHYLLLAICDVKRADGAAERLVQGLLESEAGGGCARLGPWQIPAERATPLLDAVSRVGLLPGPRWNVRDGDSARLFLGGGDLEVELCLGSHSAQREDLSALLAAIKAHIDWWLRLDSSRSG